MNKKDPKGYYAVLEIALNADAAEIKAAFRRRAMLLHPDRNTAPNATEQFQLLNEAFSVLSDPSSRAQYDTMSLETGPRASTRAAPEAPPEPIVCSCCGKVTAQPRYVIFYAVKSFIVMTSRSAIQGIFCSVCAEKKALKASAITWILGWWGFPWGPIYSIQALALNMTGGKQPADINARLAARQAWVFAVQGKVDIARAIAMDALALARKIKPDKATARIRKELGYEVRDEGDELRTQIESLLSSLGGKGESKQLKNAWSLFRRPFFAQSAFAAALIGSFWYAIATAPPSAPPRGPKPYIASPQANGKNSAYIRPAKAPNGEAWPTVSGYVTGFPRVHANGRSKVTIDNSQNDSDVFVKLVSLDGQNAYPVRTFFIQAGGSFTAERVTVGNYDVRYRDLNSGQLSRSEQFNLSETKTYDGTQFSNITMTLYKVRNGNMKTFGLGEDEF